MQLSREPFRIFFPLGVLLAWIGVAPWVLFGTGVLHAWMGLYHAFTMTEGFLVAIAAGFLGTLIPRRTGARPYATAELIVIVGGLLVVPPAMALGKIGVAQVAYLVVLGTLAEFALRRVRRAEPAKIPPSFVMLPIGLGAAAVGASLILAFSLGAPIALFETGRKLVEEGLLLGLVLAIAPMLTPMLLHGRPAPPCPPARTRQLRRRYLFAGALLCASFALEPFSMRLGPLVRGLVAAAVLWPAIYGAPTASGFHRQLYRLALFFVALGELAAGARPAWRLPFLHLTFVGGLSLLIFAVSLHVVYLHTGRERLAHARSWPVILIGALTVAAALTRACAEHLANHYTDALAVASALWLSGALVWGASLFLMIVRRPGAIDAAPLE